MLEDSVTEYQAVEGLGRLGTPTAHAKLLQVFAKSSEPLEQFVVQTLGEMNSADCQSLLDVARQSGYYTQGIAYTYAARVCRERAVPVLAGVLQTAASPLSGYLETALANSHSSDAVPLLIGLLDSSNIDARREADDALATLTHRKSQYEVETVESAAKAEKEWSDWWVTHGPTTQMYGPDECAKPLPLN